MINGLENALGANSETMEVQNTDALSNMLSSIPASLASVTTTDGGESTNNENTDDNSQTNEGEDNSGNNTDANEETQTGGDAGKEKDKEAASTTTTTTTTNDGGEGESYIATARQELGLEDDEDEEDETVEGILNIAKKAIEKAKKETKEAGPSQLYEKHPIVKGLVEHIEAGGSLVTYQQKQQIQDFSKVEIKEDDVETQEKFYRHVLEAKGNDEDEIEAAINLAKDKGVLHTKATQSKDYLVKNQQALIDAEVQREQQAHQAIIDENKKAEDEVRAILKSGKILGTAIEKTEAEELEAWSLNRNEKGTTEREVAWGKLTTEQWLLLDKIVKNEFKGLGIKIKPTSSTPLSQLKKKVDKTVNLQTSTSTVGNQLGIKDVKDLFHRE